MSCDPHPYDAHFPSFMAGVRVFADRNNRSDTILLHILCVKAAAAGTLLPAGMPGAYDMAGHRQHARDVWA